MLDWKYIFTLLNCFQNPSCYGGYGGIEQHYHHHGQVYDQDDDNLNSDQDDQDDQHDQDDDHPNSDQFEWQEVDILRMAGGKRPPGA